MDMGDEFTEWDRFYDTFERAPSADEAMERYKLERRRYRQRRSAAQRKRARERDKAQPD
jgi:hypothetical protein